MRKELTCLRDVLKKIKSFCEGFVIVTGHAHALPPLRFGTTRMVACLDSLDANDSHASIQTRIVYMMLRRCNTLRLCNMGALLRGCNKGRGERLARYFDCGSARVCSCRDP